MGIMPADREQKWQRVFRRFGLPGDVAEKDGTAADKADDRRRTDSPARDNARDDKPAKKK
jgi:hypothetical protein